MYFDPSGEIAITTAIIVGAIALLAADAGLHYLVDADFREDVANFDLFNTDEQKALDSHYFSFYKGQFVVRSKLKRSASFGIMFLSSTNPKTDANTVKHEWGHFIQLLILGPVAYTFSIAIPSALNGDAKHYYSQPWEVTADMLGGVNRTHVTGSEDNGWQYLVFARFGIKKFK